MSLSLDSKIEFRKLCDLFENISKAKGSQKYDELRKFTQKCRSLSRELKAQYPEADVSLFSIYRLILPTLERDRGPYGLKIKNLSSLYIRVFCLGKNSSTAEKLISHKSSIDSVGKHDDFAERIYWQLRYRLNDNSTMTVQNVNKFLDDVATSHESSTKKDELFEHFFRKISAVELKWLTRILLKDLKLGLSQKRVFDVIHADAEELFNVTSSLRRVCDRYTDLLSDNSGRPIEIEIFSHIKPMLLERFKIEHVAKLFVENEHYYVQTKFDGERSQLHMKNGIFKYFTRQGYDITNNTSYGETASSGGFLTSNIAQLLNKNCHSIILDGELMGWHKQRKSFGSKGLSYDVKKLSSDSCHQPCFVAYDILLYNDELLVNKLYTERLDILKSAFTEKEGVLMLCQTEIVSNTDKLIKIFNVSLDNDDEGIVIKKLDCLYRPNVREKSGCYKIKAEYSDGLLQDLDLIILGGYYGQGRNSGIVSTFLVGVASPAMNKNDVPTEFFSLVSVRSGLSDEDLRKIQDKLRPYWKDKKPIGIHGPKSGPPDVWISPKHSLVLELRATEIIKTQAYPLGYSLRFPRVVKLRLDKSWYDTCSTKEFLSLVKDRGAVQKLTKRKVTSNDVENISDDEQAPKIRKTSLPVAKVYDTFVHYDNEEITRISRLFEGKEFCIINGDDELGKSDAIKIVQMHMGNVTQNPDNRTFCILVGNPDTLRAQNIISSSKYDVASLSWLKRATRPENFTKIIDFYPWELFSMRSTTRERLDDVYDEFYDDYEKYIDKDDYERIMDKAGEKLETIDEIPVTEMKKLDKLLFNGEASSISLFRGITGYFHNADDIERYCFTFMSGLIEDEMNACIDYIFVTDDITKEDLNSYKDDKKKFENDDKSIFIVNNKWISDCFKCEKLISIDDYIK